MYLDSDRSNSKVSHRVSTTPTAHSAAVVSLTYTPDSNHLVSLGRDNQVRLWNAFDGRNSLVNYGRMPLASALNPNAIETSIQLACSNYQRLFVPGGKNLHMFGLFDGECKKILKGHFEPITCCVYNSATNEVKYIITMNQIEVFALKRSSLKVYTGSRDRNILIWGASKESEAKENYLSSTGQSSDNWSDED